MQPAEASIATPAATEQNVKHRLRMAAPECNRRAPTRRLARRVLARSTDESTSRIA
jgi:hypothetical protein